MPNEDQALRDQLVEFLRGGSAHIDAATALKNIPAKLHGVRPPNAPHSAWEILEHMRFVVKDLLEFSTNPDYREPHWPDDYWPTSVSPSSEEQWNASVRALKNDLKALESLVQNPKSNLYAEIPWAKDHQTLLHEVLLAIAHTSYHTGEMVLLRRTLGAWKS
jgi:hypothetical protein